MDPNTALANAREAAGELRNADDDGTLDGSQVGFLVESFEALDEWLSRDGFLPTDWRPEEEKPGIIRQAALAFLRGEDPESIPLTDLADALGVPHDDVEGIR